MADTAAEYVRTIRPAVDLAGPGAFGWKSRHEALDFAHELLEE